MTVSNAQFSDALLSADMPVPLGLQDTQGRPAGARFSVYRNNVVVSLSEALATAFPLVRKLIGADTFGRLAGIYVRSHPPTSPLMMFYGAEFPEFLASFEPLQHIGYLADCAQLDLALRQSYHAADASAFDPTALQNGETKIQITLAPSTRILRSVWPLYDIWAFNMVPGAAKPRAAAQDVLVTRPEFDPAPHLLPVGAADWLEDLSRGTAFDASIENAITNTPAFDVTEALKCALLCQAFAEYTTKET